MASEMSLRLVPGPSSSSAKTNLDSTAHPEHAGIHDTLRHGHRNLASEHSASTHHPMQQRLEKWDETRDNFKMTMARNMYGMGAPIRTMMERKIVSYDPHFPAVHKYPGNGIGGSTRGGLTEFHNDILNGNDESLSPHEFLPTHTPSGAQTDLHTAMERKYGL
ncbi:unnamed protein product [Sympodiomycopsis kandeliae]